jgi:hypothetical protein
MVSISGNVKLGFKAIWSAVAEARNEPATPLFFRG